MQIHLEEQICLDPVWFTEKKSVIDYPSLNRSRRCEICIVGAGISGLTAAYHLAKAGKEVIVLESQRIGKGETGSSTAHLATALHEGYQRIEQIQGHTIAKSAATTHSDAIHHIYKIIERENIDCDFEHLPGYLFSTGGTFDALKEEGEAASRAGLSIGIAEVPSPLISKCIQFNHQAQFHPIKYLNSLAKIITALSCQLYEGVHVLDINFQQSSFQVETTGGYVIYADHVINATNKTIGYTSILEDERILTRTYAIAAAIPTGILPVALYWDTNRPYHYVRIHRENSKSPSTSDHDILLVGGADHPNHEKPTRYNPFEHLKSWAKLYFPQIGAIYHQWSGCVFDKYNYLNLYSKINYGPHNIFTISGGNSNGLTHGTAAALSVVGNMV